MSYRMRIGLTLEVIPAVVVWMASNDRRHRSTERNYPGTATGVHISFDVHLVFDVRVDPSFFSFICCSAIGVCVSHPGVKGLSTRCNKTNVRLVTNM